MKIYQLIITVVIFSLVLGGNSGTAFARSFHREDYRKSDYRDHRKSAYRFNYSSKDDFWFHEIIKPIVWSGLEYFFNDGVFYRRTATNYIVVNAPVGARVKVLPIGYRKEIINNKFYYFYKNVCYQKTLKGFVVVTAPRRQSVVIINNVDFIPSQQIKSAQIIQEEDQGSFTVNVPNKNGSYTSVVLVKREEGYVGPQGELYFDFPSVEQLKAMYGK